MSDTDTLQLNRSLIRYIVLGLGALGLLVSAVTFVVAPGEEADLVRYIALGVGVLGIIGFIALDPQAIVRAISGRSNQYVAATWAMSLVFVALIVLGYVVLQRADVEPIDLTESSKYSLTEPSLELLADLEEPVHAYAFFSSQQLSSRRDEAEIWLGQYEHNSDGKFTYEFIDPELEPQEAQRLGITTSGVIVLEQGDRTAEVNFPAERDITGAIVRVLLGDARKLYMVEGHGERDLLDFTGPGYGQIGTQLERFNFEFETVNLLQTGAVPADAEILVIAGPTSQFARAEIDALAAYMDAGGALLVLADPGTGGGSMGNGVLGVAFSPDSSRIATGGADGIIHIWRTRSGSLETTLRGHTRDIMDLDFSPDGSELASIGADGTVRIWDVASGEEARQLEGETVSAVKLDFSPDGAWLVSVGEDQVVNLWSTAEYTLESSDTANVPMLAVEFSPDGQYFAAGGGRGTGAGGFAFVWEVESGEQIVSQALHENVVFDIAFSPDSSTLYTASIDGTEGEIDIASGSSSVESRFESGLTALEIDAEGMHYFATGAGTIEFDDISIPAHTDVIWDIALNNAGDLLATVSRDGTAKLWDTATGELTTELEATVSGDPLLEYLVTGWGIILRDDIVIDMETSSLFSPETPVSFFFDASSPITQTSTAPVFFTLARSVQILPELVPEAALTELLFTSEQSWGETDPFVGVEVDEADYPGPVALGVSGERFDGARIVVFGDADFPSVDALQYATYGNATLFLNTVNWLTESEEAIDLPSPDIGQRLFDQPMTPIGLGLTTVAATCLLPAAVAFGGAVLWFARRRRR